MSKKAAPRALAENEAKAIVRNLRTSPQKLNLVAAAIRGKSAASAVAILSFSKRRISDAVRKAVQSAVANAENNHQLDVDRLYIAEASVGKGMVMRRWRARARGRAATLTKPFSHLTIVVRERGE